MKGLFRIATAILALLILSARAYAEPAAAAPAPAQYKSGGSFTGGSAGPYAVISGVRFGKQEDGRAMRMVLDFDAWDGTSESGRQPASAHPAYTVELLPYPYRLVIRMRDTLFDSRARVMSTPALPFSVVAEENGMVKEMQVFLAGPTEFKVIEIDGPAKLSIDVRPIQGAQSPTVYTVQLTEPETPEQAFALVEQGSFPEGFTPKVLVLGSVVVVEDVFTDAREAVAMDASLRAMGYSSVINERPGNELPQP